jgi:hypothetical protein
MFNVLSAIMAFFAGVLGCLIGGTQAFIITGFVGIVVAILQATGVNTDILNNTVLNLIFLPCIMFNGAAVGTAYAAKHHPIRGVETSRSLAFCADPFVLIVGGVGALAGYLVYAIETYFNVPVDTGAVSVVLVEVVARLLLNQEQSYNQLGIDFLKKPQIKFWSFQLLLTVAVSFLTALLTKMTGLYTIGFSISAFSLIFALSDNAFPSTHHITIVVGYAIMQTGNIAIAVIFGILAEFIFIVFAMIFNTDCGTHIDPPAVAIASLSFILFTLF